MSDLLTSRDALVEAGRHLVSLGLSPGTSGNISVRVGDRMIITPTNESMGELDPSRLAVLSLSGEHLEGPRPSKEFTLHRAFYRRLPEAGAVVHLHSVHAVAAACLPPWSAASAVAPITPYFVMRVGQTPLISYAPPGDSAQADELEALDVPCRAALLANHGSVVAADDLGAAVNAAVELEEACKLSLLTAGRPVSLLTHEQAVSLAAKYGSFWG
ncbi:class II aldolase/adducin family protein [Kineosporia succinea]|uniref:Ribulose-5-phosphate 4-epimerase/fuculose-1-phosphate aldolase n=1 Tax=Kineosporia succinea TaxID=84632 RepID=A0ABT9PGI8_9ACTN|nr:class II aldolase/adducin family protein [Kineosporia succinea]MDP9831255.1 ribulose-5-phosphate 4-epimerase/fuculose-1-phosphate aldolase [Kineosporia succinea]